MSTVLSSTVNVGLAAHWCVVDLSCVVAMVTTRLCRFMCLHLFFSRLVFTDEHNFSTRTKKNENAKYERVFFNNLDQPKQFCKCSA